MVKWRKKTSTWMMAVEWGIGTKLRDIKRRKEESKNQAHN